MGRPLGLCHPDLAVDLALEPAEGVQGHLGADGLVAALDLVVHDGEGDEEEPGLVDQEDDPLQVAAG